MCVYGGTFACQLLPTMPQAVFITGTSTGTSTGTGAAAVRLLARHGWQAAATMRHPADATFDACPTCASTPSTWRWLFAPARLFELYSL